MAVVTMVERREIILPFPREHLKGHQEWKTPYQVATLPITNLPSYATRVPIMMSLFIVSPAIENKLLVRARIKDRERTGTGLVAASLLAQLAINEIIDPREPHLCEFVALEDLVLDCGFIISVKYET